MLLLTNAITIIRLPMIIIFAQKLIIYLEKGQDIDGLVSLMLSVFIIFSDFIDGKIARKYEVTTKVGQMLDIYLDLLYILTGISILIKYNEVDSYFIFIVIFKFLEFIIISKVLKGKFKTKKSERYYYDTLGALVSAIYYIIPLMIISFIYFQVENYNLIVKFFLMAISVMTLLSSYMKLKSLMPIRKTLD